MFASIVQELVQLFLFDVGEFRNDQPQFLDHIHCVLETQCDLALRRTLRQRNLELADFLDDDDDDALQNILDLRLLVEVLAPCGQKSTASGEQRSPLSKAFLTLGMSICWAASTAAAKAFVSVIASAACAITLK